MRLALVILLVLAVLTAPLGWYLAQSSLQKPEVAAAPGPAPATAEDLQALQQTVADLQARVDGLESRLALAQSTDNSATYQDPDADTSGDLTDNFAKVVLIADRRSAYEGLTSPSPTFLKELLGLPREDLTDDCQDMTNPKLVPMLEEADVGPIRVKMLRPAILSLQQVFKNVQVYEPQLYARIKSSGSLCVRRIRGSENSVSNHAYGLALDINIDGVLDTLGDGRTQLGLILMSEFFHAEGWVWGAGFGREDSMHFEVSREKLETWRRLGQI